MRILVGLVCLVAVVTASKFDFEIEVLEKHTRFSQKIATDLNENQVFYDTPAHNDVFESHVIQDFKQGLQLSCVTSLRECHLTDIDLENYPNAGNTTEGIVHMWNKGVNSIVDEASTLVEHKLILTGTEIVNTAFLSLEMRSMLTKFGFPLYKAEPIPKDAVVEKLKYAPRHKRQTGGLNQFDCGTQEPEVKYGYTDGRSCNHLFLCQPRTDSNGGVTCGNRHITVNLFYRCLCCPGHFTLNDPKNCQCFRFGA